MSTHNYTSRLNELRALEDGWFEPGVGKKPFPRALELAESLLKKVDPKYRFGIFPDVDGCISLEIYEPRTMICFVDEDDTCVFTSNIEEIWCLSTEEHVSKCASFINGYLH